MSPRKKKARLAGATAAGHQSKPQEAIQTMTIVSNTTRKAPESATRLVGPGFKVESARHATEQPRVVRTSDTERVTRVGFIYGDFLTRTLRAVAFGSHEHYVTDVANDISKGLMAVEWRLQELAIGGESIGARPFVDVGFIEDGGICAEPACVDHGTFEPFDRDEDRHHRSDFGERCYLSKIGDEPWSLIVTSDDVTGQAAMQSFADDVQRAVTRANVLNQGLRWRCDTCWGSPDEGHCIECGAVARAA
ncbi:hypothetical protein [Agrococcus jejuensis]|uniref:Uncharacterized protein n=1 Tax=Agrococcus jejuensis TaxID=399736 RepID=A0A1G8EZU1_9MICO|nr:hypothetical protein [Agrococcus jejuensis]SDH75392.1 hypothetical protein SAMN04489720_2262 [Agrococcus jejuensis]